MKKEIEFRDPVVERVVDKFVSRSDVGFAKYGVTLEDDKSNVFIWINHLQEELMDAVLYLQKLKESTMKLMNRKAYKRKSKKRGPVRAKKVSYDGIDFASGLEKYMYIALRKNKIKAKYEGETFVLLPGFHFENEVYERQSNGKGEYKNRGCKRILPIKYTPDFIGEDFIIETKGRANESFPMRWKLFKQLIVRQFPNVTLYKPQNQKECDETVRLILSKQNE